MSNLRISNLAPNTTLTELQQSEIKQVFGGRRNRPNFNFTNIVTNNVQVGVVVAVNLGKGSIDIDQSLNNWTDINSGR